MPIAKKNGSQEFVVFTRYLERQIKNKVGDNR